MPGNQYQDGKQLALLWQYFATWSIKLNKITSQYQPQFNFGQFKNFLDQSSRTTSPSAMDLALCAAFEQNAVQKIFIDIADDGYNIEEVDKVLSLSNNMPLAITLLANVADSEGCSAVQSRWEAEKTSMISEGYDKRSNLDLSISLSLSSPRISSQPQAQDLLSLLSMLPEGLSDVELLQSKLLIKDIWKCKTTLTRTSLAYVNEHK
jgi:hypothetical protein